MKLRETLLLKFQPNSLKLHAIINSLKFPNICELYSLIGSSILDLWESILAYVSEFRASESPFWVSAR